MHQYQNTYKFNLTIFTMHGGLVVNLTLSGKAQLLATAAKETGEGILITGA